MIEILFQDKHLVVVVKPVKVLSEDQGPNSLPFLLRQQLNCAIFPVHRLDQMVAGIMVYAKSASVAGQLTNLIHSDDFHKEYLAICEGPFEKTENTLEDFLFHDKNKNKTYIVKRLRHGVKPAKLAYQVIQYHQNLCLLKIQLFTGRTHQIRAQLAHIHHPLVGDGKYGSKINQYDCCLYSYHLHFQHPITKKDLQWFSIPTQKPFCFFQLENL